MSSEVIIVLLVCACLSLSFGIIVYCFRLRIQKGCHRIFHRKKRVHQITEPVRPTGENEIVLAVTQRRENTLPPVSSLGRHSHVKEPLRLNHRPYLLTRHESFPHQNRRPTLGSCSDAPSPLVSNLSSLQSLLMSSQVAVFNSSSERLSLSSQNQNQLIFQPISLHQQLLHHQLAGGNHALGATSPFSVSPAASSSSVHFSQPSYFDEPPPSYQESMIIRKLRASDRSAGNSRVAIQRSTMGNIPNFRRSCRM